MLSLFFNAIRPKKKSVDPVSGDDRNISNTMHDDRTSPSEEPRKANPVFSVSGDDQRRNKSLDELLASWISQPEVHSHIFSSEELVKATDNFNSKHMVNEDCYYSFYQGFFRKKPVLIKKFKVDNFMFPSEDVNSVNIRDMVIGSQLSIHGSSLKLIGFCQELQAQVFEYEGGGDVKFLSRGQKIDSSIPWRNRLSIAHDIAKALVILHTSFPTPVILRNLKPSEILIDKSGVAKLVDFSLCIQIPEGESQVEDAVKGTYGFAEPQYAVTGVLTEKADVFMFGVLLLQLLTGQNAVDVIRGNKSLLYEKVVDCRMIDDVEFARREKEFRAFGVLALKCTQESRSDRPQMVDVAAELARIRSFT